MRTTMQSRFARTLGLAALGLTAVSSATAFQTSPYVANDGLVVIEMESGGSPGAWSEETSLSGFAGSSYIRWTGPNFFGTPGTDVFGFDFQIDDPGRYHFRYHNRHEHSDPTEANDIWIRMDGGAWIKTYSWQRGQWTWVTNHELSHTNKPPAEYQLTAGMHRIEFSGRSHDFMVDRFHLYNDDVQNPLSLSHPESQQLSTNLAPLAGIVAFPTTVPENDQFSTTVVLDGRRSFDPDGDDITYQWNIRGARLVNGTRYDDALIRVRTSGELALPIELRVSDGQETTSAWEFLNIADAPGTVHGEGCVWHPVSIDFAGPASNETATNPNPFLDYRFNVTFASPNGEEFLVPGFFAGNGQGHGSGNVWRVNFTPDTPGVWSYETSFRYGENVAVSTDPNAGTPGFIDGLTGSFGIVPGSTQAAGLLAGGRLEYVGEHYLKQRDGDFFIKTGTNSPENFFAYAGFDDVQDNGGVGIIHEYEPHRSDWKPGDPLFESASTGVDSRGIIGALNYLGGQGVNSLYFLPMNLGGDGQDTTPFVGYTNSTFDKTHYDISRLHQWAQVMDHAQRQGIMMHFVLAETEAPNENWLDNGTMGTERKLFFRELNARFGFLNGIKWNLSEENDYSIPVLREMASYIRAVDAYDHPIAVHTHPNDLSDYQQIVGDPLFDSASIQYSATSANSLTQTVRSMSSNAGRKWIVDLDENGSAHTGLSGSNANEMRCEVLYDVLFSSGGIEWYCGYHPLPLGGDVKIENFRTREEMWRYSRIAREFMQENLNVNRMSPGDHLVHNASTAFGGAEVLIEPHHTMAIFLPSCTQTPELDMSLLDGNYTVRWFDPRTGDEVAQGPNVSRNSAQGNVPLQVMAPNANQDMIILLKRIEN